MKTSIIIVSYNTLEYTQLCIKSIRDHTLASSYEIIVVDNNSVDGSVAWLQEQPDVKLICNKENAGFPKGCNQGIMAATGGADILLLNSDTIVTPRWLTQLQKALYSSVDIGAVSCVANECSYGQNISVPYTDINEVFSFADKFNKSDYKKWEQRLKLVGFCFLAKRSVVEQIGFFDEQFSPGNYEDDDYSLRIVKAGYKLLLCKDTFIHHFGSASFGKSVDKNEFESKQRAFAELLDRNFEKFVAKWGFSKKYGTGIGDELSAYMSRPMQNCKKILVIDCGCGESILWLKQICMNAEIIGLEKNEKEAEISRFIAETKIYEKTEDIFSLITPGFDMIVLGDSLSYSSNPKCFMEKISALLNQNGVLLGSANNSMYWKLMEQSFLGLGINHREISAGIDCKRYYSKRDVVEIFVDLPYKGLQILGGVETELNEIFIDDILKMRMVRTKQEAEARFWLIMAQKGSSDECKDNWRQYRLLAEVICSFVGKDIDETDCRLIWDKYYSTGASTARLAEVLRLENIEGFVQAVVNLALTIYPQEKKIAISLLIEAYKIFPSDNQIIYALSYLLKEQGDEKAALQVLMKYKGIDSDILQLKGELEDIIFRKEEDENVKTLSMRNYKK